MRLFCSLSEADARHSPLADSVLLMMNFGIDKMSLEIQSRGMYPCFLLLAFLVNYYISFISQFLSVESLLAVCINTRELRYCEKLHMVTNKDIFYTFYLEIMSMAG